MKGHIILAAGGFRSGSTLQYNLIGEYVERLNMGRRIGLIEPDEAVYFRDLWKVIDALGLAVAKCHSPNIWLDMAKNAQVTPVYTVRHWGDVVMSMCRFWGKTLDQILIDPIFYKNLEYMEEWLSFPGTIVQRYEDEWHDPLGELDLLVERLGLPWSPEVADQAVAAATGHKALMEIAEKHNPGWDPRTQIHHNHVGAPNGGEWRLLKPDKLERLKGKLTAVMKRFNYTWY